MSNAPHSALWYGSRWPSALLILVLALCLKSSAALSGDQDDARVRVEARSAGGEWAVLGGGLPLTIRASRFTSLHVGTILPYDLSLPENWHPTELSGLEAVRVEYLRASANERVSPTICLVLQHASEPSRASVYAVHTTGVQYGAQQRVRAMQTALLSPETLDATVKHAAALARIEGTVGRIFAGVTLYRKSGSWIYLAELQRQKR